MPTDPEDGLPLLTWSELPRRERIVIAAVTLLTLAACIGIWVAIGNAALSAW